MARLELTQVPGIGAVTAERLRAIGIDDVAALATHPVDDLAVLPGFHASRAATVQAAARQLLGAAAADTAPVAEAVRPSAKAKAAKPETSKKTKKAKDGKRKKSGKASTGDSKKSKKKKPEKQKKAKSKKKDASKAKKTKQSKAEDGKKKKKKKK